MRRLLAEEISENMLSSWGGEILKGYQLRYIYFIDKKYRSKLKCKEIPFSEIDKCGAGMYKGKKITREERNVQCDAQKK